MMSKKYFITAILFIFVVILFFPGCINDKSAPANDGELVPLGALRISQNKTCDEYRSYISQALIKRYLEQRYVAYPGVGLGLRELDVNSVLADAGTAGGGPDDVSQTNTQEAGVDEGDIVKADANGLIYSLSHGQLNIVRGFPPDQMQRLAVLYQKDFHANELYLDEGKQTAILIGYAGPNITLINNIQPRDLSGTVIQFVDISDPSNPSVYREFRLDGYRVASRRIDQTIHLVTRYLINTPSSLTASTEFNQLLSDYYALPGDEPSTIRSALRVKIEALISQAISGAAISELLPWLYTHANDGSDYGDLLSCKDIFLPEVLVNPGLLTISSFSTDGSRISSAAVMNNAWVTYATRDSLYLVQTSGGWWWADQELRNQTAIYKFDISGTKPVYRALGSVVGWIKDRFSLSEQNGFLRLVTSERWYDRSEQRVRSQHELKVLAENTENEMGVVSVTESFGEDESVFAVRLLGGRGYVVTFRAIDPLFTFDLSDPLAPTLAGELEIPGFSTYMHPIDQDHLLTIGRGENLGQIQLQVFDVSDLSQPQRTFIHQLTQSENSYSWSPALYDTHAFTYYAPAGLLAIPFSHYDFDKQDYVSGISSFKIDLNAGISDLGSIDHADLAGEAICNGFADKTSYMFQYLCVDGYSHRYSAPRRSVYMTRGEERYLYTVSNVGVKASAALTPGTVISSVVLPVAYYH